MTLEVITPLIEPSFLNKFHYRPDFLSHIKKLLTDFISGGIQNGRSNNCLFSIYDIEGNGNFPGMCLY